ncbi:glycosyltransferase family 4 protein [Tamlana sp. s12]|uniref:glycosyltransferase family 4 protein n=1 Tax=Tamlana sp. s12 TaxID=1630406 RepID=UPI0007FC2022|nr:glycosyltransferase family 1 protein [Tamlana sp. s12]OBQ54937.1 hypothetical protein VQ01_09325 [Tamlana sp. s12]QQY83044.1 glycosyltransferase family 4 protein [Tamlana sp. s12]
MMKKNILVDAHIFDDKYQGTRTYLKGLYSELIPIATNWHFFLVAKNIDNLKEEFGTHENLTFLPLKSSNKYYRLAIELPQIIKRHKIEYAHFQYICPLIKSCKVIITTHDILFEQKEFKHYFPLKYRIINGLLFKWSAKRADLLLTVSKFSQIKISEIYKINKQKIKITPNAVDKHFCKENLVNSTCTAGTEKYLLYVSRVEPRKNHLNLLKAFVELELSRLGYKIVFIGRKDILSRDLTTYIDLLRPVDKEAILWIDSISVDTLKAYYNNCELFVFPSFAEGFGIPPLEAMSMGSKILCSKATAMMDFNLPEALYFDPNDLEELKKKILTQLASPKVPSRIYQEILNRYNWKKIAEDYLEYLEEENSII